SWTRRRCGGRPRRGAAGWLSAAIHEPLRSPHGRSVERQVKRFSSSLPENQTRPVIRRASLLCSCPAEYLDGGLFGLLRGVLRVGAGGEGFRTLAEDIRDRVRRRPRARYFDSRLGGFLISFDELLHRFTGIAAGAESFFVRGLSERQCAALGCGRRFEDGGVVL